MAGAGFSSGGRLGRPFKILVRVYASCAASSVLYGPHTTAAAGCIRGVVLRAKFSTEELKTQTTPRLHVELDYEKFAASRHRIRVKIFTRNTVYRLIYCRCACLSLGSVATFSQLCNFQTKIPTSTSLRIDHYYNIELIIKQIRKQQTINACRK